MAEIKLPFSFISPYPLNECLTRLEAKHGDYIGTKIDVELVPADGDTYAFRMYVRSYGARDQGCIDLEITGYMEPLPDDKTSMVIEQSRAGTSIYLGVIVCAVFMAGVTLAILLGGISGQSLPIALVLELLLAPAIGWGLWSSVRTKGLDSVVRIVQDALTVSGRKEKLTLPWADRLVAMLGGQKFKR